MRCLQAHAHGRSKEVLHPHASSSLSGLQVLGFLVLVSGSSLYNELIRSCLPAVYPQPLSDQLDVCASCTSKHS